MKHLLTRLRLWYHRRFKPKPRGALTITRDGKEEAVTPTAVRGLHLMIRYGPGQARAIAANETTDPENFWRWWRHLGGGPLVDEEGDLLLPWKT